MHKTVQHMSPQRIINQSSIERAIISRTDQCHETRDSEAQKRSQIRHPSCPVTRGMFELSNFKAHTVTTFRRRENERVAPPAESSHGAPPVDGNCTAGLHHPVHASQALHTMRQSSNGNHTCELQTESVSVCCRRGTFCAHLDQKDVPLREHVCHIGSPPNLSLLQPNFDDMGLS